MPFVEGKWIEPTPDDLKTQEEEVTEGTSLLRGHHNDLKKQLEYVLNMSTSMSKAHVLQDTNSRLYDCIDHLSKVKDKKVDIIIPVYNSIHLVEQCIRAVYSRTSWPFDLTVVDDGSDAVTKSKLKELALVFKFKLLTNNKNRGFAATVNRGTREGRNPYVVLLNSDVLVTPLWLTKMIMALEDNPKNQIVNPVTNNTAIINVPMSEGCSYFTMNKVIERFAERRYPEIMPTGFCFLFNRDLLDKVGYLDEAFRNFGEESDWWMKVLTHVDGTYFPGYRAVLADDTYLFHQRGASFATLGEETQGYLRQLAGGRFNGLWPEWKNWKKVINVEKPLAKLRQKVHPKVINDFNVESPNHFYWVVHSTAPSGAIYYITDLINEINEDGGDARLILIKRNKRAPIAVPGELRCTPYVFNNYADFEKNFAERVSDEGVIIASTVELSQTVANVAEVNPGLRPLLHVQSFEPQLTSDPVFQKNLLDSYKIIPTCISSSKWITKELKKIGVNPIATEVPGVDRKLFYSRGRDKGEDRPTFLLSLIDSYSFKGYDRGVKLAKEVKRMADQANLDIRIMAYGVSVVKEAPFINCLGPLSQPRLATFLGTEVDVFTDPATVHSYGMPSIEALASGVQVVSWDNKGINEYANRATTIFEADEDVSVLAAKIIKLLSTVSSNKPGGSVASRLHSGFKDKIVNHFYPKVKPKKIVVLTPHMRKHGGPTTLADLANQLQLAGHDVNLATVYSDIHPEVVQYTKVPLHILDEKASNIPDCDIIISNSDNPLNTQLDHLNSKKIMIKLSHNPRFKELEELGLQQKWDAVITSTDWLKNVCENTTEGWNYTPMKATRVGWCHYSHDLMKLEPKDKQFLPLKTRPITIGTLVHAHPSKGSSEALTAMNAIKEAYGDGNFKFIGVGEIAVSKLNQPFRGLNYLYAPSRQEMANTLAMCDIWIGASHSEGLGRMALEAMSASVACILTDTGAEYVEHGVNALVSPVDDVQALVDNLNQLITDTNLRETIATNGYATAERMSDPNEMVSNLLKVIDNV